jgi:hypothetical protein
MFQRSVPHLILKRVIVQVSSLFLASVLTGQAGVLTRNWDETPKVSPVTWLLWDFWRQKLTKVTGAAMSLPVPTKSCSVFSLRPDLGRPQLLGTGGHFSQGTLETRNITWNPKQESLVGRVRGNGGGPTTLFFHVPEGMTCKAASLGYDQVATKTVEPGVLALEVPAVREDPIPFALQFSGTPGKPGTRPFAAGPVGKVAP